MFWEGQRPKNWGSFKLDPSWGVESHHAGDNRHEEERAACLERAVHDQGDDQRSIRTQEVKTILARVFGCAVIQRCLIASQPVRNTPVVKVSPKINTKRTG